jgi:hypothetical protein
MLLSIHSIVVCAICALLQFAATLGDFQPLYRINV